MTGTGMVWLDALRLIARGPIVGLHAASGINGEPFPGFLYDRH